MPVETIALVHRLAAIDRHVLDRIACLLCIQAHGWKRSPPSRRSPSG